MNRAEKTTLVEELNEVFRHQPHHILATFRGLSVNQANALRRKVSGTGGTYRVIKNRLAKRAAAGTPVEPLADQFSGPCAVASHESDPVALAKVLSDFIKENPQLEWTAGLIDAGSVVNAAELKQLASLPGLPELRAQLLSLIQTPATSLVRLLQTPGAQLARVLDAHREAQGGDSEG